MLEKNHKLIAIRNVIKQNYYGSDSYEFCLEYNEFHLAVPKGGIVTISDSQMKEIANKFKIHDMWFGKKDCSVGFDGEYNGDCIRLRTDDFVEIVIL